MRLGARLSAKVLVDESLLNAGLTLNERFDFSRVTFNKAEARSGAPQHEGR